MVNQFCPVSSDSVFRDLDKRIDWAIGLHISPEHKALLERGLYLTPDALPSINQTSSFVNFVPMFLNVEVKLPYTDKDPLIQLGAWIAAEFEKRKNEGYSQDMPVLAVEVVGDKWNLYIFYATKDKKDEGLYECYFAGPVEMGSTTNVHGVFRILYWLCRCADWGLKEYRAWFDKEILAKYISIDYRSISIDSGEIG